MEYFGEYMNVAFIYVAHTHTHTHTHIYIYIMLLCWFHKKRKFVFNQGGSISREFNSV